MKTIFPTKTMQEPHESSLEQFVTHCRISYRSIHNNPRYVAAVVALAYNYDALTVRLEAQCKLREERERENDALTARVARLEEALKQAAEDLQLVGDDYPGSSCHKWCSESAATARAALADRGRAALNELHQIDQEIFGQQATPGDGHGT